MSDVIIKITENRNPANIIIAKTNQTNILVQQKGIKGDPGTSSNDLIISKIAGENISGGKAVIVDVDGKAYVFNINNENHYGKLSGIAKQAGLIGSAIDIYIAGEAVEVGSGWQSGVIYFIGDNGTLTSTVPDHGIVKAIGVGVDTDTIFINNGLEIITS